MAIRTSADVAAGWSGLAEQAPPIPRRWLVQEVWLVFGLSLGASGVNALLHLLADLTNGKALRAQTALLNGSQAPGRPWLDLALQLTGIAFGLVPVLLVAHFLMRSRKALPTSAPTLPAPHRRRQGAPPWQRSSAAPGSRST